MSKFVDGFFFDIIGEYSFEARDILSKIFLTWLWNPENYLNS